MENITNLLHEIISVIIFVAAISFLMLMYRTGVASDTAADMMSRNKTNITENKSNVTSITETGASVYYDIVSYSSSGTNVNVIITPKTGAKIELRNIAARSSNIYKELQQKNFSTTAYGSINPTATYEKSYGLNSVGQISTVYYREEE